MTLYANDAVFMPQHSPPAVGRDAGSAAYRQFSDQAQMVMFLKNVAMAGGLVLLAVAGPGAFSFDARRA